MNRLPLLLLILTTLPALAQTPAETRGEPPPVDAPPPPELDLSEPPLPPKEVGADQIVPTVRIRREEGNVIEEYSVNGQLYMVKITPKKGPAYYLIDTDGDGELETRDVESDPGIKPVYWKLFEWD